MVSTKAKEALERAAAIAARAAEEDIGSTEPSGHGGRDTIGGKPAEPGLDAKLAKAKELARLNRWGVQAYQHKHIKLGLSIHHCMVNEPY